MTRSGRKPRASSAGRTSAQFPTTPTERATPEARYASAAWAGRLVVNTTYTGAAESYHIYLSPLDAPILRETLEDAGAIPARDEQVETERILNGKPRYGVDITDTNLTAETGLTHALHFSKGCYLGQEIVERVRSRGHVNKVLTRIEFEGEAPAGTITSQTTDPATNKTVALAYVRP